MLGWYDEMKRYDLREEKKVGFLQRRGLRLTERGETILSIFTLAFMIVAGVLFIWLLAAGGYQWAGEADEWGTSTTTEVYPVPLVGKP